VRRSRVVLAVVVALLACAGAASAVLAATRATGPTTHEVTITASDGAALACGLVLPGGSPPAGGWPGLLLFHGLGQTHATMEPIATAAFAPAGFASLTCDARGTGASGGKFGLDGPREVQDARDLFAWLAGRSDVSDTAIGAVGLSLGGGEVWNAAAAGVPFKAIVPGISWTSLAAALTPHGVVKAGLLDELARAVPRSRWDPVLAHTRDDLARDQGVSEAVGAVLLARSSLSRLHSLKVPTLILQGRQDFLFDLDQALAAYKRLSGPKRLYLGDLGHAPAANPAAEQVRYLARVVAWLREYLDSGPKLRNGVELAHDPWDGKTSFSTSPPRTRHQSVNLLGATTLAGGGSLTRSVRLTGGPLETFGDGSVTVRYSGAGRTWTQLVATLSVQGKATPVSEGAALVTRPSGVLRIPLLNESVLLPRSKKLVVTLSASSKDGVYRAPPGSGSDSISVGRVTLNLSLLRRTVSR
jgi:alpha-beta hydrolase superfamily lysophospholipase